MIVYEREVKYPETSIPQDREIYPGFLSFIPYSGLIYSMYHCRAKFIPVYMIYAAPDGSLCVYEIQNQCRFLELKRWCTYEASPQTDE
jgi:hypothetical protein